MKGLSTRLADLEQRLAPQPTKRCGPAAWMVMEQGESEDQTVARYEAEHGALTPGQLAVIWRVCTGVPRGEGALCA